jgi:PAS domain S-box-containing protein
MVAEAICDRLTDAGYEVVARPDNAAAAIEAAVALHPDLILMDVRLKGAMDGIRASELINEKIRVPVVYLTGDSDQQTLRRARAASAYGYVLKPFHIRNLIVAIQVAVDRFEMEQRLEDSQLTYATILGSITDGVIAVDTQGCIRFMNGVAERLTGWPSRDAQQKHWREVVNVIDSSDDRAAGDLIGRVLSSQSALSLGDDAFVISKGGVRVPVDCGMACVVDNLGRVVGASIRLRDVTSMRKAEADLKSLAQQLRAVIDTAVDGVVMLDAAGTIRMINPACERLFRYAPGEMTGINMDVLVPSIFTTAADRRPHLATVPTPICRRRDGSTFPAEISIGEAAFPGDPLFVAVIHDVSERRNLEAALLDAVGREQRRFATDLHDGLGQELTGLSLLLAALANNARAAASPHAADLGQACEVVRHALQSCQAIARGLSPIGRGEGGLVGALRDLVTRLKKPAGPNLDIAVSEMARLGLSPAASDHLYRIAQEALTNALKHAHANSIRVTLSIEPESVRLEICDDGGGVKVTDQNTPGLGLRTMQYRASMIGARFKIAPFRPTGTRVICECPQGG